jgi:glycogen(starch) synthase
VPVPPRKPRVALVSRELYPFDAGGMGNYVNWTARALADVADVKLLTTDRHRARFEELSAAGDPRLDPRIELVFVPDPDVDAPGTYYGYFHRWSANAFETLAATFPGGGPDLVEFPDYHGEAAVTVQARRSHDPRIRRTLVCVRVNTSSEMAQVLDGRLADQSAERAMLDLERYSLRFADRVVWPGGDVLDTYRRFYGADGIATPFRIPHAVYLGDGERPGEPVRGEGPLRILYVGRLERRKGVVDLVEALLSLEREDWTLSLLGGDTPTGPLGVSMRGQLELLAGGDERIRFCEPRSRDGVLDLIRRHDVVAIPSRWECWPNVALEAFLVGRPVLATPTGGLVDMVREGRSGFLTAATGPGPIAETAAELVADRGRVAAITPEETHRAFAELTDADEVRSRYLELIDESRTADRPATPSRPAPLVSVVVTYFRLADHVEETVESLLAQTHPNIEIVLVNDGSFDPEDRRVFELADRHGLRLVTQANSGLSAARNLGVAASSGDYVMPFDADDLAEPDLIERCLAPLEADPGIAYVTSWSKFIDERGEVLPAGGYQPLGNSVRMLAEQNVAGGCASLFRREAFDRGFEFDEDLASYEDWFLFRELADAGLVGHVIPERLYGYRIREGSMARTIGVPQRRRMEAEMEAHLRDRRMDWEASREVAGGRAGR